MKIAVLDSPGRWAHLLNLGLGAAMAGLLVWYVFLANLLGSFSYQEDILKIRLAKLSGEHNLLLTKKSSGADLSSLFAYVRRAGLIEQKSIEYVFNEKDVAQAGDGLSR